MPGQRPKYKAIVPGNAEHKTVEVGAAWETSKEEVFSVRLTQDVRSFILVPNEPSRTVRTVDAGGPKAA